MSVKIHNSAINHRSSFQLTATLSGINGCEAMVQYCMQTAQQTSPTETNSLKASQLLPTLSVDKNTTHCVAKISQVPFKHFENFHVQLTTYE